MLKVIKNDLFSIKNQLIVIAIIQFVLSLLINAALLFFETGRIAAVLLKINDIAAQIITASVVILMLSNLFIKQRKPFNVYDMSVISQKDIIIARYLEIFLIAFASGLLSLIHVTFTDGIITAKYLFVKETVDFKNIVFLGSENFLYILFPVSIGICGMLLQSSVLLLCNLYNSILSKVKALSVCIGVFFITVIIIFFGDILIIHTIGIDFNKSFSLTGLLPYNTMLFFSPSYNFGKHYIFAANILQPFVLLFLLMVITINTMFSVALKQRRIKNMFFRIFLISLSSLFIILAFFLPAMEITVGKFTYSYLKEGQTSIVLYEGESFDLGKFYFAEDRNYNSSFNEIRIFKQEFNTQSKRFVWVEQPGNNININGNKLFVNEAGIYRLSILQERKLFFETHNYNMLYAEIYVLDNIYDKYINVYQLSDFSNPNLDYVLRNDIIIDGNPQELEYFLFPNQVFYGKIYNPENKKIIIRNSGNAIGLIEKTEETSIIDGLIIKWEGVQYGGQGWVNGIVHENKGLINNCRVKGDFIAFSFNGVAFFNDGTISNCNIDFDYMSYHKFTASDNDYNKPIVSGIVSYNNHNIVNCYVTAEIIHGEFYPECAYPNLSNSHIFDCGHILYEIE